jgi:ABC-2 type transport system ATP-binding protein
MSVLEVVQLSKSFGDIKAVDGLNFNVNLGNIYGLLGVNGSGKSTTIRLILNLITPDSGSIFINGKMLRSGNLHLKKKLGALIERPDFYLYLSAFKNLQILLKYSGLPQDKKKIQKTLEIVGLRKYQHKKIGIYSQGMKQRLGIAQAIIHDPDLIILDEPFNGLDPQGIVEIRNLVSRLSQEFRKTIILSSHMLKEIELISDRMLVMYEGRSVAEGKVDDLLQTYKARIRIKVSNVSEAIEILRKTNFSKVEISSEQDIICEIKEEEIPRVISILVENQINVFNVIPERSLEDYFMSLV